MYYDKFPCELFSNCQKFYVFIFVLIFTGCAMDLMSDKVNHEVLYQDITNSCETK